MDYRVCVLRAPGTNCDAETSFCLETVGLKAPVVHIKRFLDGKERFHSFHGLVLAGGFSYGDHVRAGALLGKILKERFSDQLLELSDQGNPILGICNGFQILVECGLLPGESSPAALTTNLSSRFECRWTNLLVERSNNLFTQGLKREIQLPVAHGEGRFLALPSDLVSMEKNNQIALRYASNGRQANGRYPGNPNGALDDIAGIYNKEGNILGLMPHPERAFHIYTHPRWTRLASKSPWGDGYKIFKNIAEYIMK